MKNRHFILFLLVALLSLAATGCSLLYIAKEADRAEERLEQQVERVEEAVENTLTPPPSPEPTPPQESKPPQENTPAKPAQRAALTAEQAQAIAVAHSGYTVDTVRALRAEYDVDNGVAHYEVEFEADRWDFDYDIHAETGAILSWDKDD